MADTARLATALGDRYRIERELGAGGMATVYLATDVKHDREVALKVLRPELGAVLGSERFLAEIRIAARLDHPHILTLIDSGEAGGLLYYVLPFVRGESLRAKLEREQQLGLDEALTITRQIASALAYAHEHGVIHRDIKPENILIHEGEAVLADFGIALAVREAGGNRLTETGLSLGTPQYMSPEQATGDRRLDARSDVYSLGAVLYEMLAGEAPVTGATAQAMIAKLMTERPTRLRVVRDTVPEGVDNAVAKALAKVPADRFNSAAAFADALKPVAGRRSWAAGVSRGAGGWRVLAIAGAIVVALAVAVSVAVRGRAPAAAALERVQLTFTGTVSNPALSTDGQRVAYASRACVPSGTCTYDVVVQDVGGAGTATLARGFGALWHMQWSRDGRWLLMHASLGSGRWGLFGVPTLGGTPRHLGCCGGDFIGSGDTVLMLRGGGAADSLVWVRRVTITDGVVHDSVGIRWPTALSAAVVSLDEGRRMLLVVSERDGFVMATVDRQGRVIDTVRVGAPDDFSVVGVAGGAVTDQAVPGRQNEYAIIRYPVDAAGRFARRPDTLVTSLGHSGELTIGASGQAVLADGAAEFSIWAMRRPAVMSMRFDPQRLAVATAPLSGSLSPVGDRVLVVRTVSAAGRTLRQMSLMPFDSGPETPLGAPVDLLDWEFSIDGTQLYTATARGADSLTLQAWALATGRPRDIAVLAQPDYGGAEALPGGGLAFPDGSGRFLHVLGAPGRRDTAFTLPESAGYLGTIDNSPDGSAVAAVGWDFANDSIVVHRIDLLTGAVVRLAAFSGEGWDMMRWLPGDVLQFGIMETAGTLAWYTMPARGGRVVRMGTPPRYPASYRQDAGGRRVIARARDPKADVFLIRNFADRLRH